jgi:hypothetical protein
MYVQNWSIYCGYQSFIELQMLKSGEWRVYVLVASTMLVRYACLM